ncbi:sperm equatorial segment protein 1 [Erinaceus europaeus]|uniref:Sperm equatorial segment protein 1 n=1 Tax=Erinaceus europaeus TaxID=9365 RepID=A0ABM3W4R8_ERIEU|nr:sperm equatorial segment protein 1 [Erinaceus europaeus]
MAPPVLLLVALLLWPPSMAARRRQRPMTPDEEQSLSHYVQALQDAMLSVPTREPEAGRLLSSPGLSASRGASRPKGLLTSDAGSQDGDDSVPLGPADGTTTVLARVLPPHLPSPRPTKAPFWAFKRSNVSVVLRPAEPYVVQEPEPEPEPEPRQPHKGAPTPPTAGPELEDVPQLLDAGKEGAPPGQAEILDKLAVLASRVRRLPLAQMIRPEFRADMRASREHLRRSLALAEAAEHKLRKMYRSHVLPGGRDDDALDELHAEGAGDTDTEGAGDTDTEGAGDTEGARDTEDDGDVQVAPSLDRVVNLLYRARARLPDYLDPGRVPARLRRKARAVVGALRSALCSTHNETHTLIRRLLNNNIRMLNLLDVL